MLRHGTPCAAHISTPLSICLCWQCAAVIVKSQPYEVDPFGVPPDVDLDWGDFFFNLVSMCIVYVYFSKAAVAGESLVAILLCMGVAAFDIVLLVMRWLWFEQYINYG